jgi:hypothetical protein
VSNFPGYANIEACDETCSKTLGCVKAVFDTQTKACHIKALVGLTWVIDPRFDSSRLISSPATTTSPVTTAAATTTSDAASATAVVITECPTTETTFTSKDGKVWAICQGSDYQGLSVSNFPNYANMQDCDETCSKTLGCTKAVFDEQTKACHIKSEAVVWVVDPRFDSSRLLSIPIITTTVAATTTAAVTTTTEAATTTASETAVATVGIEITACPVPEVNYSTPDGRIWLVCPGSDYHGTSNTVLQNSLSIQECANTCSTTTGCVKSVFDTDTNACHLKGSPVTWVLDPRFNSARLISIDVCPTTETQHTTDDGRSWFICPGSDYVGNDNLTLQGYLNVEACDDTCSVTAGCIKAVFDTLTKACHIKSSNVKWVSSPRFTASRVSTADKRALFGRATRR